MNTPLGQPTGAGVSVRIELPIRDLACGGGDALAVERALLDLPGVVSAYVNPVTEIAYVDYDPSLCQAGRLVDAIEAAGFRAG